MMLIIYKSLLFILLLLTGLYSQLCYNGKYSDYSIGFEFTRIFPKLKGKPSLDIINIPGNSSIISNFQESKNFNDEIYPGFLFGIEALHNINGRISIGLSIQYRSYGYNSEMYYSQEKLIAINNLLIATTCEFRQEARIKNTSILTLAKINLFKLKLSKTKTLKLEFGSGMGTSVYNVKASVPYAFLKMKFINDYINAVYKLGPGQVHPEYEYNISFTWNISTTLIFNSGIKPIIALGSRFGGLGKFIIMKRSSNLNSLFKIKGENTQNNNTFVQELSLNSTNHRREIFNNEIFLRFYIR